MKAFFRTVFILVIFLLITAGLLGYLGLIPQIAAILGTDKPRDLGINYTDKIADEANNKTGMETKTLTATDNPPDSISYMGKHPVDNSFTSEELTAIAADKPWKYYPVSRTQIKITGTEVEISGLLRTDRIVGYATATGGSIFDLAGLFQKIKLPKGMVPFYLKGSGSDIHNKISIRPVKVEIGRLSLPLKFITPYDKQITSFLEERINNIRGASIESLTFRDNKMFLKGTLPDLEGMTPEDNLH